MKYALRRKLDFNKVVLWALDNDKCFVEVRYGYINNRNHTITVYKDHKKVDVLADVLLVPLRDVKGLEPSYIRALMAEGIITAKEGKECGRRSAECGILVDFRLCENLHLEYKIQEYKMNEINSIIAGLTELRDTGKVPPGLDLDLVIKIVEAWGDTAAKLPTSSVTALPCHLPLRGRQSTKALDALFDRFWTVYPRKVAKADAKKAFGKISPDEELLQRMIKALERDKRSSQWTKDSGQFIPYASTWLNGRRWEDEGEAVPERSSSFDVDEFFELALKHSREKMANYTGG